MNLTANQVLAIIAAIVSALVAASTQLTDIFGPTMAKSIVGGASLVSVILNSIIAALTGQTSVLKSVAAMPGVERISVNAQASQALAMMATDPAQPKVGATTPTVREVLKDKANN